jgi:hypothetical protein
LIRELLLYILIQTSLPLTFCLWWRERTNELKVASFDLRYIPQKYLTANEIVAELDT